MKEKMREHITHHDDCGCLSQRLQKRIDELEMKLLWVQRYFQEREENPEMANFIQEVFGERTK